MIKQLRPSVHPYEVDIGRYLSSEPLASDPANHSVPLYEVLRVPNDDDRVLVVMPLLRRYDSPRFDTFGETVHFFQQLFEVRNYIGLCIYVLDLGFVLGLAVYAQAPHCASVIVLLGKPYPLKLTIFRFPATSWGSTSWWTVQRCSRTLITPWNLI